MHFIHLFLLWQTFKLPHLLQKRIPSLVLRNILILNQVKFSIERIRRNVPSPIRLKLIFTHCHRLIFREWRISKVMFGMKIIPLKNVHSLRGFNSSFAWFWRRIFLLACIKLLKSVINTGWAYINWFPFKLYSWNILQTFNFILYFILLTIGIVWNKSLRALRWAPFMILLDRFPNGFFVFHLSLNFMVNETEIRLIHRLLLSTTHLQYLFLSSQISLRRVPFSIYILLHIYQLALSFLRFPFSVSWCLRWRITWDLTHIFPTIIIHFKVRAKVIE